MIESISGKVVEYHPASVPSAVPCIYCHITTKFNVTIIYAKKDTLYSRNLRNYYFQGSVKERSLRDLRPKKLNVILGIITLCYLFSVFYIRKC